jgi:hypothetical protein
VGRLDHELAGVDRPFPCTNGSPGAAIASSQMLRKPRERYA